MDSLIRDTLNAMREPLSIASENRRLRALFYGDTDAGKTTLASQLVEDSGCLVNTDSNYVVILKNPEIAAKIDRYPYDGFSQLKAIAEAHTEGIEPFCCYDTLIIDTISTGIDLSSRRLVNARKYKDQVDPDAESWTHYRLIERYLRETIDVLSKSDLNIIYLMHLRYPTDKDLEKKKFAARPNGPEACFKILAQEVQLIGWLSKEDVGQERIVTFEGTKFQTAKSQISTVEETQYKVTQIPSLIRKWKNL